MNLTNMMKRATSETSSPISSSAGEARCLSPPPSGFSSPSGKSRAFHCTWSRRGSTACSNARKRRRSHVSSGYCRQTVEAAFRRFREVTLGGGDDRAPIEDRFDAAAHLSRLASKLSGLSRLAVAPELAARVEALGDSGESLQRIEDALTAIDDELVEFAEEALDENDRDALRSGASASLASYRDRMPDKVYQSALKSAYLRRLRDKAKLPRLSLYDR